MSDERKHVDWYSLIARERLDLPEGWRWFQVRALPGDGTPCQVVRVRGAVPGVYVRGPRKGQPSWKSRDKTTDRELYITPTEIKERQAKWSQETGGCHECSGNGNVFSSWSKGEGAKYRTCHVCNGTGKAMAVAA